MHYKVNVFIEIEIETLKLAAILDAILDI